VGPSGRTVDEDAIDATQLTGNDALGLAADVVLDRLGLSSSDTFLVVANPELIVIATALTEAARSRSANVHMQEFPATSRDGEEPPEDVTTAMGKARAIAIVTRFSLSHTHARMAATHAGARIASMPGISPEIFMRTVPIDYTDLERAGRALARKLTETKRCRVTAPGGTDLELLLEGREAICDDGDLRAPSAFGNLPAGEAYIAPVESHTQGTIVFDGSLGDWGLLDEPVTIELRQGRIVTARGRAASSLLKTLDAGGANGRILAELGIGTNPGATIGGQILEDEKAVGSVHLAFGSNISFGGTNQATVHIDGLVRDAVVELDGHAILRDSRFVERS
jgi:leucyl aminopeptidase (aminopeptidase T)